MRKTSIEKRSLQNAIAGFFSFGLSIVQSILLVPLLLRFWGEEKYALWIALWAFVSVIRVFDLGFLGLIGNEFTLAYHVNKEKAANVLGSAVRITIITGSVELILYLIIWALRFADDVTGIPETTNESNLFVSILILLFPWALGGSVLGVVLRAIPALGLYSKMVYISILMKIAEITILILGAWGELSIFTVSVFMSVSLIMYAVIVNNYLRKIMPDFYPWWRSGTWYEGFTLFKKSLALTINNFLEQYTNSGIIIIISKTIGLAMLPIFTTIRTITNTASQVTSIVLDPLYPDFIRFHVLQEYEKISQIFLVNWLIMGVIINIPFSISLFFIEPLYNIWTSHKLIFNPHLFYLLTLSVSVSTFGRPMITYIKSLNLLYAINLISVSRFVIIFGLSIPFIQHEGLWVLGLSLLISEIMCSIILPFIFIHNYISHLNYIDIILGLFPTFCLSVLFLIIECESDYLSLTILFFLFIQFCLALLQWSRINNTTRSRILAVIPFFSKKKI